jgi:Tfp pilus assembly protein PilZ
MWQSPNQRVRAQVNARKRERERMKMQFHVKRVLATVELGDQKIDVRLILNDLTPKGMGLFSSNRFSAGDEVTIHLESPKKMQIKGKIAWCQEYEVRGKVLTAQSFSYRVGLSFVFATKEEEATMKAYCDEVMQNYHCLNATA